MKNLIRGFKENQGMRIEREGVSLDIVVDNITGSGQNKRVKLRVMGVEGVEPISLSMSNNTKIVIPGIKITYIYRKKGRGHAATLLGSCPDGYSVTYKDYQTPES